MKTKILSIAIISIIILPLLSTITMAKVTDDTGCKGSCIDTTTQSCSVSPTPGLCTGPATRMCCTGTVSDKSGSSIPSSPSGSQTTVTIPNPLGATSFSALIDNIVTYLIEIASIILPIVIIYAAYLLMTAGGEMDKVIMGRKTITWAIVGYILILISKGITMIVANILGAK
jgi:hypothetical protein